MTDLKENFLGKHRKFRTDSKKLATIFVIVALIVAVGVFWWLKLVGITITGEAFCGSDEHSHTAECYADEIVCGFDEESATENQQGSHKHTDACFSRKLICTLTEHTHSADCYPDYSSDTETVSDWLKTFENVEITNDVRENLIAIASSQLGYEESSENFEYDSEGNKNGYTRYGEWYGNPYGNWNVMFMSFCLHYSNIYNVSELESAGAESMKSAWCSSNAWADADGYTPGRGDIVFFDANNDGFADSVAVILSADEKSLTVICGDSNNKVEIINMPVSDSIKGFGLTGELRFDEYIESETEYTEDTTEYEEPIDAAPLMLYNSTRANITYINDLTSVVTAVSFRTLEGEILGSDSTVYIGQTYVISMEFAEVNTGDEWIQFRHDEDHHLHYQIPDNIHCEPFTEWHTITAKTENGTIEAVGRYFIDVVDGIGKLVVIFDDDPVTGECFGAKYSNVDFTIEFNATVGSMDTDESTEVEFNDEVKVTLNVDGGAGMTATKSHTEYNGDDNTIEYTLCVEATHGIVKDLVIDDEIWNNHYVLRDTIVVTDLDGNVIDPQPVISDSLIHSQGGTGGFSLSGFPDFSAGKGYLVTYKSSIHDYMLGGEEVSVWNGVNATGKDSNGTAISDYAQDWENVSLEKMAKDGKQSTLEDDDGNIISVIEWDVAIRKHNNDLHGTVVIDTLGHGLEYYTQEPIYVVRYDEWGYKLPDVYIDWSNVTINGNSMSFELPSGFAFDIIYYTTHEQLTEGEQKEYTNSVSATINGKHEQVGGTADVVGFIPYVSKSASGDDGDYVYFTVEADVPAIINDWGHFYITDIMAFWGYNINDVGYLYVENNPVDMIVTAVTESGNTITFTPYVEGGPTENTYTLIAPANGKEYHSFNILFNTAGTTFASSRWMLDEDAKLIITYKIPFDAKTGTEWEGELTGDKILEDILLEGYNLANEVYLNYSEVIIGEDVATYKYSPKITKKAEAHNDGTIDYKVVFHNTVPGSGGNSSYLNGSVMAWFTDTFDEKLEYVDGTLTVTCYDPWRTHMWLAKYTYNGDITGNSINVSADKFVLMGVNPEAADAGWNIPWLETLNTYYLYYNNIAAGDHVFTYTLKVRDEHMYSTEYNKYELENTAEVIWGTDGTSGTATEKIDYETGLIDKQVAQEDNKLNFVIHINRHSLDILKGIDTLTIEDTMTANISVYWNTIKFYYEDENGNWIDFDSTDKYDYNVTYDQLTNTLRFTVPDELHIKIDYTTLITESGMVSVANSVTINASAQVSDIVDATFKVVDHSGDASGFLHNTTLLKQDGLSKVPLPGAVFLLYGPMGNPDAVLPEGADEIVFAKNGTKQLRFIGAYTTGEDGTVYVETQYLTFGGPYAFVEYVAPEGYDILETPTFFYFYADDPDGIIQSVTTLIAIENYREIFSLPETGGTGTLPLSIIGLSLMATPILYSIIRRKRERRIG